MTLTTAAVTMKKNISWRTTIIPLKWLKYYKMHYANFQQCKICDALQEPTSSSGLSTNDCKHL